MKAKLAENIRQNIERILGHVSEHYAWRIGAQILIILDWHWLRPWPEAGRSGWLSRAQWVDVVRDPDGATGLSLGPVTVWWEPAEAGLSGDRAPREDPSTLDMPRCKCVLPALPSVRCTSCHPQWQEAGAPSQAQAAAAALPDGALKLMSEMGRELRLMSSLAHSTRAAELADDCDRLLQGETGGRGLVAER